jgi:hypothetical protein
LIDETAIRATDCNLFKAQVSESGQDQEKMVGKTLLELTPVFCFVQVASKSNFP